MTTHPLQQKISALGRRVRSGVWLHQGACLAVTVLALVVAAGLLDYALRLRDRGVRTIVTVSVVIAAGWTFWRRARIIVESAADEIDLAQRVESKFPDLKDRLASSLDFLARDPHDAQAGSWELRQAVIDRTVRLAESRDFSRAVDLTQAHRWGVAALLTLTATVGLWIAAPGPTSLALQRFAAPWSDLAWPRRNALQFVDLPAHLAHGANCDFTVVDANGRLPERVQIAFRQAGGDSAETELFEMKPRGDQFVYHRENITHSFQIRAIGGDDDDPPWHSIVVVPPPVVESFELLVIPPEYTGWASSKAVPPLRALAGSRIELRVQLGEPVASALLRRMGTEANQDIAVPVIPPGHQLELTAAAPTPWQVEQSATYVLLVTGSEGLPVEVARWVIESVPDRPPTVTLQQPADESYATPRAQVSLVGTAKDDVAVQSLTLLFRRSDEPESTSRSRQLWSRSAGSSSKTPSPTSTDAGDTRPFDAAWNLAQIENLAPGMQLIYSMEAVDALQQTGTTGFRRLTIVTADEMAERVARRQANLVQLIQDALRLERVALEQASDLHRDRAGDRPPQEAADRLQGIELQQRQIRRLLSAESDGAQQIIRDVLRELRSNRLEQPELDQLLNRSLSVAQRLSTGPLPTIEQRLSDSVKTLRIPSTARGADVPWNSVGEAINDQREVVTALEQMIAELVPWDDHRRFARELSRIRQEQGELRRASAELLNAMLQRDSANGSPPPANETRRLADRQFDLARQLDRLFGQMERVRREWTTRDPEAATTLADTLEIARRNGVSGLAHDAGESLRVARLGEALERQDETLNALQELLDRLANRRQRELERIAAEQQAVAHDLAQLRQEQDLLRQRITALAASLRDPQAPRRPRDMQRLATQQQELATRAEELSRRLKPLSADDAAQAIDAARQAQRQASQALEQSEPAQGATNATTAKRQLEQAEQLLAAAQRDTQQALAQQHLARWEQAIAALAQQQRTFVDQLAQFNRRNGTAKPDFSPEELTRLVELAQQERQIAQEVEHALANLPPTPAFVLVLRSAKREMQSAAEALERRDAGPDAQRPAASAAERLNQLVAAFQDEPPPASPDQEQTPPSEANNPPPNSGPAAVRTRAELVVLRDLQTALRDRTAQLEKSRNAQGQLPPNQQQELEAIASEQGELARLVQMLLDDATKLPSVAPPSGAPLPNAPSSPSPKPPEIDP